MGTMELIALKADPAALAKGALNGADQAGRGPGARPGFETFADILAASETARRKDEVYEQAFDDSGMDELEEESLLREAEEEEAAQNDKPAQENAPAGPATVTEFLPFQLRPQMPGQAAGGNPELQQQLMASTATQAMTGPATGAAPAQVAAADAAATPEAGLQANLMGLDNRAAWRQDSMAEAAVRRGDKREALIQPAAAGATNLGTVFGKGTAPGNLILAAGGQVGGQGQNGHSGSQSNLGGQNGQSPTQLPQAPVQAQADPAAVQARAEQFAAAMAGQGREMMGREAAATGRAGRAGQAGTEALRAEAVGQAGTTAQTAGQAGQPNANQVTAVQASAQADQAQKAAQTQAQQAPQQARPAVPQPPIEQVAVRIATMARDGMDQIRIQLEPADLGRVDVRLHMQDGAVTATVMADNQDTLDLLQRDSRTLQQALQDAGLKTSSDGLNYSLRDDGRGAPADDGNGGRGLARNGKGDDGTADATLTADAGAEAPQWRSDRALDIVA